MRTDRRRLRGSRAKRESWVDGMGNEESVYLVVDNLNASRLLNNKPPKGKKKKKGTNKKTSVVCSVCCVGAEV